MEVTTVSSSPASPTEGDDLCEIDVTSMAMDIVTLLICLCGLVGNGAVLGLISQKACNRGIFELALADFLFLLFIVPSTLLFLVEDVSCSPIMPLMYLSVLFQLSVLSCYWALFWFTSIDSLLKIFRICCSCNLPVRLVWLVDYVQFWLFLALFMVMPALTNLCPSHQQQHCQAAFISVYAIILLLFAAPMLISSTIDFIQAKWGSKKQQPKRCNMVISLIVLFNFLFSLCNFLQQFGYIVVSPQVFFLLNCIQSSIKPFIYFLAGRCWSPCALSSLRLSLQRVFDDQKKKPSRRKKKHADKDTGV